MKTVKIADATNIQLDWLVATCAGIAFTLDVSLPHYPLLVLAGEEHLVDDFYSGYSPTKRPGQMWPIIEREGIELVRGNDLIFPKGNEKGEYSEPLWLASRGGGRKFHGPTSLIAAARCYVASKLGETVEVPEELT